MIKITPELPISTKIELEALDRDLIRTTGLGLRGLALASLGLPTNQSFPMGATVAAIPVTCGNGSTRDFADSIVNISIFLGLKAFVTKHSDVSGIEEAYAKDADVILMADGASFIAHSTRRRAWADNSECTALGYVEALQRAAGNLAGEEVLVIGAGQVGMHAIRTLLDRAIKVKVVEKDPHLLRTLVRNMGLETHMLLEEALVRSNFIFNASPAPIPGSFLQEGVIISNPGTPLILDDLARRKAKAVIHDPIAIGTSVMLVKVLAQGSERKEKDRHSS